MKLDLARHTPSMAERGLRNSGRARVVLAAMVFTGMIGSTSQVAYGQGEVTLNACQKAVAKEGGKYAKAVADTVGKCLLRASSAVIVNGGTAADAAAYCAKGLLKITNSAQPTKTLSAKFDANVSKACDPDVNLKLLHAESDIYTVGSSTLGAGNIAAYCEAFAGSGTIANFDDWKNCIRTAAECQARQAIATQWPRALEYTAALLAAPAISGNTDALTALSAIDAAIEGTANDNLPEIVCGPEAGTCGDGAINAAGEQCDGMDLGGTSCTSLGFDSGTLSCSSCAFDTSSCACAAGCTGNAAASDVLAGKTFSNAGAVGLTGTMPDHGAVTITPATANQTIAAGYHDGSGYCAGDSDLTAGNIKTGTNIFGVGGTVIQASGNAAAGDVLLDQTFSNASGAGTGTMPNNGAVTLTPGTASQAIAAGYHNGSGSCAGDTDLIEGNIRNQVTLFGVEGTVQPPPLMTGATFSHGPGSDGDLQLGAGFSFTNNFDDGTVTDHTTGLMWEKKSNDGSVHDKDNLYDWSVPFGVLEMDGTITTVFLAALNSGSGFAGYTDWRIPNVNELLTLARFPLEGSSHIAPVLNEPCPEGCTVLQCSCTNVTFGKYYLSSTSNQTLDDVVYGVEFGLPSMGTVSPNSQYVRAVRGGYRGCSLCANEPGTCTFSGTRLVRYGANGKYFSATHTGSVVCNNASFGGDPAPGVPKHCDVCGNP